MSRANLDMSEHSDLRKS